MPSIGEVGGESKANSRLVPSATITFFTLTPQNSPESIAEKLIEELDKDPKARRRIAELTVTDSDVRLAIVNAVLADVATKRDIERLESATKRDLERLEASTKRELEKLEAATKRELENLRVEMKAEMERLRSEIQREVRRLEERISALERRIERSEERRVGKEC